MSKPNFDQLWKDYCEMTDRAGAMLPGFDVMMPQISALREDIKEATRAMYQGLLEKGWKIYSLSDVNSICNMLNAHPSVQDMMLKTSLNGATPEKGIQLNMLAVGKLLGIEVFLDDNLCERLWSTIRQAEDL